MSTIKDLTLDPSTVVVGGSVNVSATVINEELPVDSAELVGTVEPEDAGEFLGDIVSEEDGSVSVVFKSGNVAMDKVKVKLALSDDPSVSAEADLKIIAGSDPDPDPELKIKSIDTLLGSIPNDGSLATPVTVVVVDAEGNAAANATVTWSVSDGGEIVKDEEADEDSYVGVTGPAGRSTIYVKAKRLSDVTNIRVTATLDNGSRAEVLVASVKPRAPVVVLNATIADGWTLDEYDIAMGVTAEVPLYEGAAVGDGVTFVWGSVRTKFLVEDIETSLPKFFNISEMDPALLAEGTHDVYYYVKTTAGNFYISTTRTITVEDAGVTPETMPAPKVPEGDDGYINVKDASNGVDVYIDYPEMKLGDTIKCFWEGFDSEGRRIALASGEETISVDVVDTVRYDISVGYFYPNDIGYQGHIEVSYKVTPAGGGASAVSYKTSVRVDTHL